VLTSLLMPWLPGLRLGTVTAADERIIITLESVQAEPVCPLCGQVSHARHSWYQRKLSDLPWAGVCVQLQLRVRRMFCRTANCRRVIFTERLSCLALPYARRTKRLAEEQRQLALQQGGEAAARITHRQGMPAAGKTLLRFVRRAPLPAFVTPRCLGVDDWAFRKRKSYGTILVDLDHHRPVDLLADRSSASLEGWLRAHPGVVIITRDRSHDYAEGALRGAPDAVQVADRFHLVKNVHEVLQKLLERHSACLRAAARAVNDSRPDEFVPSHAAQVASHQQHELPVPTAPEAGNTLSDGGTPSMQPSKHQQLIQENRARRYARYEEVQQLHTEGASMRQIAIQLGIHYRTVRRFLAAWFPERAVRPPVRTILDPHIPYLMEQLRAGHDNSMQLWRELRDRHGYRGSRATVSRWVVAHRSLCPPNPTIKRKGRPPAAPSRQPPPRFKTPSARIAAWLLLAGAERLDDFQVAFVGHLLKLCPDASLGQNLANEFRRIVTARDGQTFDRWLAQVEAHQIPEFTTFVAGLRRDDAAVRAALSLPFSNGQVEGQVNRLKLVKRTMYGRASFDLLKRRVLAA
jgi:transposase